jgi:hypothetical protein
LELGVEFVFAGFFLRSLARRSFKCRAFAYRLVPLE